MDLEIPTTWGRRCSRSSLGASLVLIFWCYGASADCVNPSGPEGLVSYGNVRGNVTYNRMEYCDGTNWHDTSWIPTNTKCSNSYSGQLTYTSGTNSLQFCNGTYYVSMQGPIVGGGCGTAGNVSYVNGTGVLKYCGSDGNWRSTSACRIYLKSTGLQSLTVPADWSSSYNRIEVIAGGGGGGGADMNGNQAATGGGGGGYSLATNVSLTGGATVNYAVGAAGTAGTSSNTPTAGGSGGNSYFCSGTTNCGSVTDTEVVAGSYGGGGGYNLSSSPNNGGLTVPIAGNVTYSGGSGGAAQFSNGGDGGGGGGAGGLFGAGAAGQAGSTSSQYGGQGDSTRGGQGGIGGNSPKAGWLGTEYFANGSVTYGSGGGGGGDGNGGTSVANGGLYGGGGGGGGDGSSGSTGAGGAGAQGLIVLTYSNGSSTTYCDKVY